MIKKILLILLCLPVIGFGQPVNIPDVNFKAYLIGNTSINTNGDTEIQVSEANLFNGAIYCNNMNISDLTGIEYFINLTDLSCSYNQLVSLDITQNYLLENLFCENNNLTYIDLSSQTSFINLYLNGNNLSLLDLSHFGCGFSHIAEINLVGNPNLQCIQVNSAICWDSYYSWSIDTSFQYYSANCGGTTDIQEHSKNKELIKIIDLLARETKQTKQPLFYIYDDGTVEKKIIIE